MDRFKEVDINRVLSILLIVILHSLAFYTGAWAAPDDFQSVGLYKYLGKLCGSVAVPSFVFISGFLFRSQITTKKQDFASLIKKKAKRLLLPSVIFSILYVLLFNEEIFSLSSLFDILNGAGHLWFLPMLFCSFCASFYLFRLPNKYSLLIAALLPLLGGGVFAVWHKQDVLLSNLFYTGRRFLFIKIKYEEIFIYARGSSFYQFFCYFQF